MPSALAVAAAVVLLAAVAVADVEDFMIPVEMDGNHEDGPVLHLQPFRHAGAMRDNTLGEMPVDALLQLDAAQREHPLSLAKQGCQAGWTETQKQCGLIDSATTTADLDGVKAAIRTAGEEVFKAVQAVLPSNSTAARFDKMREALEADMTTLGESMSSDTPSEDAKKKTLGHLACTNLWSQVETLCAAADAKAEYSTEEVKAALQKEGQAFETHAAAVADTDTSQSTSNETQVAASSDMSDLLMESKGAPPAYAEDEYVHNLDSESAALQPESFDQYAQDIDQLLYT